MAAALIGLACGLVIILLFLVLKKLDKKIMYGLILAAIGFLYVGFVWEDRDAFILTTIQAIAFTFIGYYGTRNLYILAGGYILHGSWDIAYNLLNLPGSVPPQYDLFCSVLDFTIGIYLLVFRNSIEKTGNNLIVPGRVN